MVGIPESPSSIISEPVKPDTSRVVPLEPPPDPSPMTLLPSGNIQVLEIKMVAAGNRIVAGLLVLALVPLNQGVPAHSRLPLLCLELVVLMPRASITTVPAVGYPVALIIANRFSA